MLNEIVTDVCRQLDEAKIEYMLSGSVAMGIYVPSRNSLDVDVVINLKEEDISTFINLFSKRYYMNPATIREEVKSRGMFNMIDNQSSFKVDFLILKNSEYRSHEFERKYKVNFLGTEIWTVSIEDLILSKLIWIQELESDMQKRDIASLLLYKPIDFNYLSKWITKLHLNTYNLL